MATKNSDYNMHTLKTKDLTQNLLATIQVGGNVAIFGRRGSGKTEIAKQCIRDSKVDGKQCKEVYINLSVLERVDLGGYPDLMSFNSDSQKQKKFVDFLLPRYLEKLTDGDSPIILLLDEVDKADNALQAPLLEITQFRSVNGRPLPNLHCCVMTGNLISEGSQRPSLPLLDRAEKYLIEPDAHMWLEWAGKGGNIHPSVTAFINDHPGELFGEMNDGDNYADPSPRGWKQGSNLVAFGEENGWGGDLISTKIFGSVGKKAGMKFKMYFDHYQHILPMIDKIMKGEDLGRTYDGLEKTKQIIVNMVLFARLARILDDSMAKAGKKQLPKEVDHVGKFIERVEPEMILIAARTQIGIDRFMKSSLDDVPAWAKALKLIQKKLG